MKIKGAKGGSALGKKKTGKLGGTFKKKGKFAPAKGKPVKAPRLTTTIEPADSDEDSPGGEEMNSVVQSPVPAKGNKNGLSNGNESSKKKPNKRQKNANSASKKPKVEAKVEETGLADSDIDSDDLDDEEELTGLTKDTLERLKEKDPDFYKYLQQHDKELLDLDDEEEENADEDILNDDVVDDDAADEEEEGDAKEGGDKEEKITLKKVNEWSKVLRSPTSKANDLSAIKSIIKAFRKTVTQTTDNSEDFTPAAMSMLNPSVFNAIINSVLVDLVPALLRFLRLQNVLNKASKASTEAEDGEEPEPTVEEQAEETKAASSSTGLGRGNFFDPRRSRNWKRVQSSVKIYLTDVLKMLGSLSADARASFERHILELTPFFNVFPHLIKRLIRRSIDEWCGIGGTEDRNRVLAYLVLHRTIRVLQSNDHLTGNERQSMVNQILRKLYMSYVAVARNTNESSIAQISFMKNSLVELYRLDDQLAYQHAFIFIRQLAINLRSSFILKEKNSLKTVYNWQFVHSILLWSQLISSAHNQTDVLDPLISPLVMVITGTIKLLPTVKFIPLRFHLIRALIMLSSETGQFIPILRYFLEIYTLFDPNKVSQSGKKGKKGGKAAGEKTAGQEDATIAELEKAKKKGKAGKEAPKKASSKQKAINFEVMLKVNKEQTTQVEFVEKVFDKFYALCLQYMVSQSASIAFPEMVTIFLHQSRKFISSIRMTKERTSMKQLVDKIQENSNFIFQKRKTVKFSVLETANIISWERQLRLSETTPLAKFSKTYKSFKAANVSVKSATGDAAPDSMDKSVQEKVCAESGGRTFNVASDLVKKATEEDEDGEGQEMANEEDEEDIEMDMDDELDDDELAKLEGDFDDEDEEEEDDEEEIEFDGEEDVELSAEQFAKIQKKIAAEEKKLKGAKGGKGKDSKLTTTSESGESKKRKKKTKKEKAGKKPRRLNNDLQLEGAFDMSSDED